MTRVPRLFRWIAAAWLAAAAVAGAPAVADDGRDHDHDHDRARAALQAGEVMPLGQVMARLRPRYPGELLEVELEREGRRWIYELKLLQPGGALVRLHVDARTAEVLKSRSRGGEQEPAASTVPERSGRP